MKNDKFKSIQNPTRRELCLERTYIYGAWDKNTHLPLSPRSDTADNV